MPSHNGAHIIISGPEILWARHPTTAASTTRRLLISPFAITFYVGAESCLKKYHLNFHRRIFFYSFHSKKTPFVCHSACCDSWEMRDLFGYWRGDSSSEQPSTEYLEAFFGMFIICPLAHFSRKWKLARYDVLSCVFPWLWAQPTFRAKKNMVMVP